MKNFLKKAYYYLQLFDGVWSVPVSFLMFYVVGMLLTAFFGLTVGSYDAAFIQPLFLSICVIIGAANAALGFLYFFCRGIFKWFYGFKTKEGKRFVPSIADWDSLRPQQRFHIFIFLLFAIIIAIILVYIQFV